MLRMSRRKSWSAAWQHCSTDVGLLKRCLPTFVPAGFPQAQADAIMCGSKELHMKRSLVLVVALLSGMASAQDKSLFSSLRPRLLAISVADAAKSEAWYRDNFGFQTIDKGDFPDYSLKIVTMELNGFRFEVVQLRNAKDRRTFLPDADNDASITGFNKFDFVVDNPGAVLAHVKTAGTKAFNICSTPTSSSFMLRDLDGNLWQFLSHKPLPKDVNARSLPNGCWPGPVR